MSGIINETEYIDVQALQKELQPDQQDNPNQDPSTQQQKQDPSQPLPDKRRERIAKMHADGMDLHAAWINTSNRAIKKQSAYKMAVVLRKDKDFSERVLFLRSQKLSSSMIPDVTTAEGRRRVLQDVIGAYYRSEARAPEVISALKELSSIYGDREAMERERKRLDPADICAWLVSANMQGLTPGELIAQEDGLKRVARAVVEALGVDSVQVMLGEDVAAYRRKG